MYLPDEVLDEYLETHSLPTRECQKLCRSVWYCTVLCRWRCTAGGLQTPHRCSRTLVLACTRDIDVWEAGAIWEAQRWPSLQGALGHADRRDWRGVNREVGWAGGCGRFAGRSSTLYWVRTSVPSAGTQHYPALRTAESNHLVKATGPGVFFLLVGPETGKGLQGSIRLEQPQALEAKSRSRHGAWRETCACLMYSYYVDASFVGAKSMPCHSVRLVYMCSSSRLRDER